MEKYSEGNMCDGAEHPCIRAEHNYSDKKSCLTRRNVLLGIGVFVAVSLIIGLSVALIITRSQLENLRSSQSEVYVQNKPIRVEISDKTLQRASDFVNYGQPHPTKDTRPPHQWH